MTRPTHLSRRDVLKSAAASLPLLLPAAALGRQGPAPSDKVNVGIIGVGNRWRDLVRASAGVPDVQIVSVCDCFAPRVAAALGSLGKGKNWTGYTDFRRMIDKEKLDGVMVETTTHARAWVTCHAMAAGLDAYIEKPMCLSIAEGREMVNAARKYGRVTQVGTQQRSIPLNNWASDLVKNGTIGKVKVVLAPNFVGPVHWEPTAAQKMPTGGPAGWWDIWTNQAQMRPYHRALHHGWIRYWAYDGGGRCFGVTGWGAHSYDQIQRGLGTDETGPVEIVLEEPVTDQNCGKFDPRKPTDDETGARYYALAKSVVGPRAKIRMKYADGTELRMHLDGDRGPGLGCIFVGADGKIEINRDKVASNPKSLVQSADSPGHLTVPETQPHVEDWVRCIKTRERCTADIEYGQRSSTLCYLVNIARALGRVGEPLRWDPVAERFPGNDEANALLSRERRKGYELPT